MVVTAKGVDGLAEGVEVAEGMRSHMLDPAMFLDPAARWPEPTDLYQAVLSSSWGFYRSKHLAGGEW